MSSQFLSSEEYDERAHQLYNEGRYDEAIEVLQEGLAIYPNAVELHVGIVLGRRRITGLHQVVHVTDGERIGAVRVARADGEVM